MSEKLSLNSFSEGKIRRKSPEELASQSDYVEVQNDGVSKKDEAPDLRLATVNGERADLEVPDYRGEEEFATIIDQGIEAGITAEEDLKQFEKNMTEARDEFLKTREGGEPTSSTEVAQLQAKIEDIRSRLSASEIDEDEATRLTDDLEARIDELARQKGVTVDEAVENATRVETELPVEADPSQGEEATTDTVIEPALNELNTESAEESDLTSEEETILETELQGDTVQIFESLGFTKESLREIPGFTELTEGQQMLVAENMRQAVVGQVAKKAYQIDQDRRALPTVDEDDGKVKQFFKKAYVNSLQVNEGDGKIKSFFKKTHSGLRQLAISLVMGGQKGADKLASRELRAGGENMHGELLRNYVAQTQEANIDAHRNEQGEIVIDFLKIEDGMIKEQRDRVENYNNIINTFMRIPQEWAHADSKSKEYKQYQAMKVEFDRAQHDLYTLKLEEHGDRDAAIAARHQMTQRTRMFGHLAGSKDSEDELLRIANQNQYWQSVKGHFAEKGGLMAMGMAARTLSYTFTMGLANGVIGAAIGSRMGKLRGEKDILKQEMLAKEGIDNESNDDRLLPIEHYRARLERRLKQVQDAKTPEERAKKLASLKAGIVLAEGKFQRQEFAKDGELSAAEQDDQRFNFLETLAEASVFADLQDAEVNQEVESRFKQFMQFKGERIAADDEEKVRQYMKTGAIMGFGFASLGYGLHKASEHFGWFGGKGLPNSVLDERSEALQRADATMFGTAAVAIEKAKDFLNIGEPTRVSVNGEEWRVVGGNGSGPVGPDGPSGGADIKAASGAGLGAGVAFDAAAESAPQVDDIGSESGETFDTGSSISKQLLTEAANKADVHGGDIGAAREAFVNHLKENLSVPPDYDEAKVEEIALAAWENHFNPSGETVTAIPEAVQSTPDMGATVSETSESVPQHSPVESVEQMSPVDAEQTFNEALKELQEAGKYIPGHPDFVGPLSLDQQLLESAPESYTVKSGDNLWNILKSQLEEAGAFEGVESQVERDMIINGYEKSILTMSPEDVKEFGITSGNPHELAVGDTLNLNDIFAEGGEFQGIDERGYAQMEAHDAAAGYDRSGGVTEAVDVSADASTTAETLQPTATAEEIAVRNADEEFDRKILSNVEQRSRTMLEMRVAYQNMYGPEVGRELAEDLAIIFRAEPHRIVEWTGVPGGRIGLRDMNLSDILNDQSTFLHHLPRVDNETPPVIKIVNAQDETVFLDQAALIERKRLLFVIENLIQENVMPPTEDETVEQFLARAHAEVIEKYEGIEIQTVSEKAAEIEEDMKGTVFEGMEPMAEPADRIDDLQYKANYIDKKVADMEARAISEGRPVDLQKFREQAEFDWEWTQRQIDQLPSTGQSIEELEEEVARIEAGLDGGTAESEASPKTEATPNETTANPESNTTLPDPGEVLSTKERPFSNGDFSSPVESRAAEKAFMKEREAYYRKVFNIRRVGPFGVYESIDGEHPTWLPNEMAKSDLSMVHHVIKDAEARGINLDTVTVDWMPRGRIEYDIILEQVSEAVRDEAGIETIESLPDTIDNLENKTDYINSRIEVLSNQSGGEFQEAELNRLRAVAESNWSSMQTALDASLEDNAKGPFSSGAAKNQFIEQLASAHEKNLDFNSTESVKKVAQALAELDWKYLRVTAIANEMGIDSGLAKITYEGDTVMFNDAPLPENLVDKYFTPFESKS